MLIVKVMGGLGNQLQQYAFYKKLESLGKDVRLDVSWFRNLDIQGKVYAERDLELDYFEGISYREATKEEIRSILGRLWEEEESVISKLKRKIFPAKNPCFVESEQYHPEVYDFTDKYLTGYFACEKYYADILPKLRTEIKFPVMENQENLAKNEAVIRRMQETDSVSVHIRRGDYLDAANAELFGGICTEEYYQAAISYLKERFPKARFFFFSDDSAYVKEHYTGEDSEIIDWNYGKESFYDIMLMSQCKHNICANSTFSFWGARLNENPSKIMIRPSIHKNTQVCVPEQMKELWKDWVLLTPQGEKV